MKIQGEWQIEPDEPGAYVIDDPLLPYSMTLAEFTGAEIRFIPTLKLGSGIKPRMKIEQFRKDHPGYQFLYLGEFPDKSQIPS